MANFNESMINDNNPVGQQRIKGAQLSTLGKPKSNVDDAISELERIKEEHQHEVNITKYGRFGKIFGAEENSSKNLTFSIVFIILILWLILSVISIWTSKIRDFSIEMFKIIIPIITLAFGYFFGKK